MDRHTVGHHPHAFTCGTMNCNETFSSFAELTFHCDRYGHDFPEQLYLAQWYNNGAPPQPKYICDMLDLLADEGEVPSRSAAELRANEVQSSKIRATDKSQTNPPGRQTISLSPLALTQGPARSFPRSAAPQIPVTQRLESHAYLRGGSLAPESFSLVSNVQSNLGDTMVSLMSEVSTVDIAFFKRR